MRAVRSTIKSGTGQWFVVSTFDLPFDHSFGGGAPQLFETMVFASDGEEVTDWMDLDCARYATEDEALDGHTKMVEKWRSSRWLYIGTVASLTPEDA